MRLDLKLPSKELRHDWDLFFKDLRLDLDKLNLDLPSIKT